MPRRDGTGPMGMGPMTGWGIGRCGGYASGNRAGRGRGLRRNHPGFFCRGIRHLYNADAFAVDEKTALSKRADILEARLSQIRQRLTELNTKAK